MDNREALGSWLSGPRAAAENAGVDFGYRGQQLGLPEEGPGSIARPGRRIGALAVDWALCMVIAYGLVTDGYSQATGNWALLILLVLSVLTVGTIGSTPGKRIFGLRVASAAGGRLGILRVLLRSVLVCLAIPALIWDRDGRGLHDRLSGAVQVRV
ncbi:RDD family protein [Streptomyces sp. NPDC090127]|uniref:RDD family protein n=1 Tax=Streptomyces sp. NPDC090127 TaxID=3365953 RepID=UPI0038297F83